jgi:LAGLIDADG DNA endonuclease family
MPCITELRSLFYPDLAAKKAIPVNIYDLLTPVALAHLIMGDGGFKSQGVYLCTDSYTIQDVVRLMNVLIVRYDLKCTLHKSSNGLGYRIYISRNSVGKVVEIVKPYLIPSMYYKVGIM